MPPTTVELVSSSETNRTYYVKFYNDVIFTTLTHTTSVVDDWINETLNIQRLRREVIVVGLDTEWRPSFIPNVTNSVAILQLCIGHRCLIFQLIHSDRIPQSLIDFLQNPDFKFVGVGIDEDVQKLLIDYDLEVDSHVDLRVLAKEKCGNHEHYSNIGLKDLALEILEKELEKPRQITISNWSSRWLSNAQVQYACLDAFVSSEIGTFLTEI